MALNLIRVNLELDTLKCYDEGDGWGSAEPYLWSVFFKVDGSTVHVTDSFTLSGTPTVEATPGSHGNLGDTDVDGGDTLSIPSAIGEYETILSPIPGPPSFPGMEFGGVVGVVVILMEEDNVSDDGAEAGHAALNNAVRDALQSIIDTRSISNQDVTDKEIDGFTDSIGDKVRAAIKSEQNIFENIWSWLNPDDTIGTKVFLFNQSDLDPSTTISFSKRWQNEGDWEIFGHISSSVLCSASAARAILSAILGQDDASSAKMAGGDSTSQFRSLLRVPRERMGAPDDLNALREFRDGEYRKMPGLSAWYAIAERHSPRLGWLLAAQPELRESVRRVLDWATAIATKPDAAITDEQLEHAGRLAKALTGQRSRRARIDGNRILSVLPLLKGKTNRQAMNLLHTIRPARHPGAAGVASLRVRRGPR